MWHFDFRQVSAAKTLCDLARSGVTTARLRKSLEQLATWLPEANEPLKQLSSLESGQLMVRLEDGDLADAEGQLFLDFDHPAARAAAAAAPDHATLRLHAAPTTAAQWYRRGDQQREAGYLAEAVDSYRQALLIGGPDATVCYRLAYCLAGTGRREQAAERYAQAVEIDPDFAPAWCNLGVLMYELDRPDEACAAFQRALDVDPDDAEARFNLAALLDDTDRCAEALEQWRAYLACDQTSERGAYARRRVAGSA